MLKFGNKHRWTKMLLFHTLTERVRLEGTCSYLVQFLALNLAAFKGRALLSWVLKKYWKCRFHRFIVFLGTLFLCLTASVAENLFLVQSWSFACCWYFLFQKCATKAFNTSTIFAFKKKPNQKNLLIDYFQQIFNIRHTSNCGWRMLWIPVQLYWY